MEKFLYPKIVDKTPKLNVWFAFAAIESFAMASVGYLIIFKMLDCDKDLFVERIYKDTKTTLIAPKDVDLMGFSVSFELDILNIIKILKKYDIALKSSQRDENDPFLFCGGPVMMANPIPYEEFFDFISVSEKISLPNAIEIIKKNKGKLSKDEILKEISKLDGIYVPKYPKEKIKILRDELKDEIAHTTILSDKSYFKDTFIIELERGCPKLCKFCLASWINHPTRFVEYDKIIETIDFALSHTNKIALLGAYVAGHPDFKKIINYISKKCEQEPIELSISSLRADKADIDLIKTLVKCGQKTATIALEAGSERLRNYIRKDLSDEQILNTVLTMKQGGLKGVKIYVMVGLPTEDDEDISKLINLIKKIKDELKKIKPPFEITLSASTFIPKAHTPFENVNRLDKKTIEKRINYLKKSFHKMGVDFRPSSIDWDVIQAILSRYDRPLGDFLIDVTDDGASLGSFKKTWRKYNKMGLLPSLEDASINPIQNKTNPKWNFIVNESRDLKMSLMS